MEKKRLFVLLGSICLILVIVVLPFMAACAKPVPAQPTSLTFGWGQSAETPFYKEALVPWAERIEERTEGRVEIGLRSNGDHAIVEIRDSGTGMDEEFVKERLFRPFDSTKGLTGMGIGAYECREFIRALGGQVDVESAGSRPADRVNPRAVTAMKEKGYDLSIHETKSIHQLSRESYDAVVTMGCGDECPAVPAGIREDWPLEDPRDLSPAEFNRVRDSIEGRVIDLLDRVQRMM